MRVEVIFLMAKKKTAKKSKKKAAKKSSKKSTMKEEKCWATQKVKKMDAYDLQCVKLGVFVTALLVAKLWSPILSLEWYWYAIIAVVAFIRPFHRIWLALCK